MSAPLERGPLPTDSFPFSELTPEALVEMVDGRYMLEDDDQEDKTGWAGVDLSCGVCIEFNRRDRDNDETHSWLELNDVDSGETAKLVQLDDAEVIKNPGSLTFVVPFGEDSSEKWVSWATVTDSGYSLSEETMQDNGQWLNVPLEILDAADRATTRQAERLVAAGNGS